MCGIRRVVLAALVSLVPVVAGAQTVGVTAGAGFGRLWDDETNLGSGLQVSGGVNVGAGDHVVLGAAVERLGHSRSLTYFGADGQALGVVGRASYAFGGSDSGVRPVFGAGLGVLRSTGTLHTPNPVALGVPGFIPMIDTPWSLTRPLWQVHAGVRIRGGSRLTLQPEVRWSSTWGGSDVHDGIEPPLLGVQAMLSLEWQVR